MAQNHPHNSPQNPPTAVSTARALGLSALVWAGALLLASCGHSDSANAPAASDNVEMPAEEALSGVTATPAPDASATATDAASAASTPADATSATPSAGDAASTPAATPAAHTQAH